MISWINCIQQRVSNLEAWIALAKFRSTKLSPASLWNFGPDAPPHTPYILHPNWRFEEQSDPSLFNFQDICGSSNGSLGNISAEDLSRIGTALRLAKQESITPAIPGEATASCSFPPINFNGPTLFGNEACDETIRKLNKQAIEETKNQFREETEPINLKTVNSHKSIGSSSTLESMPSLITMSDDSNENNNSPRYTPSSTTSPENQKQRDFTSSPSYSYDDSSEESVSSDSDLESSVSLLPHVTWPGGRFLLKTPKGARLAHLIVSRNVISLQREGILWYNTAYMPSKPPYIFFSQDHSLLGKSL